MKLYYKPGACSLASHIALIEAGEKFELEQVDTVEGKTASGGDFRAINPKGYVPVLTLDGGETVTEGAAILQLIAERNPDAGLVPAAGGLGRTRLQEQLNFIASELHKAFGPFFSGKPLEGEARDAAVERVNGRMRIVEAMLGDGRAYLNGAQFSVADAYLFVVTNWANFLGLSLDGVPNLKALVARVAERPATRAAMQAEGLLG